MRKVKLFSALAAILTATALLTSCAGNGISADGSTDEGTSESSEEIEIQTLTIENDDYYSRFRGQNISINVYNWGEYISTGSDEGTLNVNKEFTDLTGIKVNYTNYATNEELYAKLKGGGASYDIIIPSDYMIARMIKEDMLLPLNLDNIPNLENVDPKYRDPIYDPGNQYSIPYTFGTVGIIYNKTRLAELNEEIGVTMTEDDIDWDVLWDENYADEILMFDNPRDAFAIAEIMLGFSINTEDENELIQASDLLKDQKKFVQAYVMDEIFDKMSAGDAIFAPYYAGDAVTLMAESEDLGFIVPPSSTNLFYDAMCIPASAKQQEAAEMYINFMCESDIGYATTMYIGYSTPLSTTYDMLDDEVKFDGISYPDDDYIINHTEVFNNLSDEANLKMQELWTEMKSAQDESVNKWLVPLFLFACIAASLAIVIRRNLKKKKDIF